jgi:hypothetical protein
MLLRMLFLNSLYTRYSRNTIAFPKSQITLIGDDQVVGTCRRRNLFSRYLYAKGDILAEWQELPSYEVDGF